VTTKYRKDRTGVWVVFGPTTEVRPGEVAVTKADGTVKAETVTRVSRPFVADGVPHVYGYLEPAAPAAPRVRANSRGGSRRRCVTNGNCSSFGSGRSCGAPDCDGY
jgi:hypothetical protein